MADIFLSFSTGDTLRVQPLCNGLKSRGLNVFWSHDIPKGAPDYQSIIRDELLKAPIVIVVWTKTSVQSGPVVQECSQAERANKLFQVLFDEIDPIELPMEVKYKSQKTLLLGWAGDQEHHEWIKLQQAIDMRLAEGPTKSSDLKIKIDTKASIGVVDGWFKPGGGRTEWFRDHEDGPKWLLYRLADFSWDHQIRSLIVPVTRGRNMLSRLHDLLQLAVIQSREANLRPF